MLGLYLHIPFCSAICNYCNFNRGLFDAALKARYVDALVLEIERAGGAGKAGEAEGAGAPAAMPGPPARQPRWGGVPSRGRATPRRGIGVSSRWGWGPSASEI